MNKDKGGVALFETIIVYNNFKNNYCGLCFLGSGNETFSETSLSVLRLTYHMNKIHETSK